MLVLLDRDGVINEDLPTGVQAPEQCVMIPRAAAGIGVLTRAGFICVVVTNQSVIGRGLVSNQELDTIHAKINDAVKSAGGNIAEFYVCPDHPDHATFRRKPRPGMLLEALEKYGAVPEKTAMVGDAISDMEAAHAAGCPRFLVRTGKGAMTLASGKLSALHPVEICEDLWDAAMRILATVEA